MGLFFWQVPTPEELSEQRERRAALVRALDEREAFVRSRCNTDWTATQLRLMKVGYCGFDSDEIALVLGCSEEDVAEIESEVVNIILAGWPRDEELGEAFIGHWFYTHKECCTVKEHAELLTDHYPLADLHGVEQPRDRLNAIMNYHVDFSDLDDAWFDKPYCDPPSRRRRVRPHYNHNGRQSA